MLQLQMIEKVRSAALHDENISAVLMYGSFIKGEGDRYSDIEFYIYHKDGTTPDKAAFVSRVAPLLMFFTNGHGTDVAVFDNLIRGEFHFHPVSDMSAIKTWQGILSFEHSDKMNIVDKEGALAEILNSIPAVRPDRNGAENRVFLAQSLINDLIFARNLILRGEYAHAHRQFSEVQRHTLWLLRLYLGNDDHWLSPTKKLEEDIPCEWYAKYVKCVPGISWESLRESFNSALELSGRLISGLCIPESIRSVFLKIERL